MDKLKIVSYNAHGLNNLMKRRKLFRLMKTKMANIVFIQEVHGCAKTNSLWSSEWDNRILFANGSSNSGGVAILFNKSTTGCIQEVVRDINSWYLMCKWVVEGHSYCLVNIYAPNEDCPEFFLEVFQQIEQLECTSIVIGGDFNMVMDPMIDRSSRQIYHKKAHQVLEEALTAHGLADIWRLRNQDKRVFTSSKMNRNKLQWSRIDYFLISENLVNLTIDTVISAGVLSDHSMIGLDLQLCVQKRGRGVWKINDSHLENEKLIVQL